MYPNQGYGMPGYGGMGYPNQGMGMGMNPGMCMGMGMNPGMGMGMGMGFQGRYMFTAQMIQMQARPIFMKYDFNRNGVLDIREAQMALNEFSTMNGQMPLYPQDLATLFMIFDSDGSHQIDYFEFVMMLEHLSGIKTYDAGYVMQMRAQRAMRLQQYMSFW